MRFYRIILTIPCTENLRNEKTLKKKEEKRKFIPNIRMIQLKFLGVILRKEAVKNLILKGHLIQAGKKKTIQKLLSELENDYNEGFRGGNKETIY